MTGKKVKNSESKRKSMGATDLPSLKAGQSGLMNPNPPSKSNLNSDIVILKNGRFESGFESSHSINGRLQL